MKRRHVWFWRGLIHERTYYQSTATWFVTEREVAMRRPTSHHESSAVIRASAERVFRFLDDHASLSSHMGRPSWRMGGASMQLALDESRGKSVGSHIRLEGSILGIRLAVDEVVTERTPPCRKQWETVGTPRLLVMGRYSMGFEVTPLDGDSLVRVFIDYELPDVVPSRWLGALLGRYYAQWCVRQMVEDAVKRAGK